MKLIRQMPPPETVSQNALLGIALKAALYLCMLLVCAAALTLLILTNTVYVLMPVLLFILIPTTLIETEIDEKIISFGFDKDESLINAYQGKTKRWRIHEAIQNASIDIYRTINQSPFFNPANEADTNAFVLQPS